jgi:hypothetical protein
MDAHESNDKCRNDQPSQYVGQDVGEPAISGARRALLELDEKAEYCRCQERPPQRTAIDSIELRNGKQKEKTKEDYVRDLR